MDEFEKKTYEEISEIYGDIIEQDDIDTIVNNETRFFVWAVPDKWWFNVVPVYRDNEELYLGACRLFYFENEKYDNLIAQLKMENASVDQSVKDMTSPDYLEKQARDRLGMIKNNETYIEFK